MSDIKKATDESGILRRTHIGGQALIEGVMMRGRYNWAVAVREPSGNIYTEEHDLASGKKKNKWMYWPIIRGVTAFVESLALGFKALEIAGNHAYDFSEEEEEGEQAPVQNEDGTVEEAPAKEPEGLPEGLMLGSMIFGIFLGVAIFVIVPAAITNLIMGDYGERTLAWNIVDGILRIVIFIAYIWLISLMKDIRRMFAYHGAEHKTIHCYERGLELTPENAKSFPCLHVRCGTAFLLTTMIIAILVFTIVPVNAAIEALGVTNSLLKLVLVIISRILLLPVVAGLSYEVTVKWAGTRPDNPLVRIVLWPGLQMQRLTTNEPDEGMLECAIAAMNMVLEREKLEEAKGNEPVTPDLSPCAQAN